MNNNESEIMINRKSYIENFRQAPGLTNIYRSGTIDDLVKNVLSNNNDALTREEQFVLNDVYKIIDLRAAKECDEKLGKFWMSYNNNSNNKVQRNITHINLVNSSIAEYVEKHMMTTDEAAPGETIAQVENNNKGTSTFEERCFFGLYEVMLETSKKQFFDALKEITLHFENNPGKPLLIHCSHGKDRTALLVMLCQCVVGVQDQIIIDDYHLSEFKENDEIGAPVNFYKKSRFHSFFFKLAPKNVMKLILDDLNTKYGSVSNYLTDIGFNPSWQIRFKNAIDEGLKQHFNNEHNNNNNNETNNNHKHNEIISRQRNLLAAVTAVGAIALVCLHIHKTFTRTK
jgi:protein tyrosine/serine phosphatase